jgi:hypothetical protein
MTGDQGEVYVYYDESGEYDQSTGNLLNMSMAGRSIRMTLSLAFLAPEIVKAAVEGRLPRGFGLKRLVDLPMAWPDQWRTLGLQAPAQA